MKFINPLIVLSLLIAGTGCHRADKPSHSALKQAESPGSDAIITKNVTFNSEGVTLAGTIYMPKNPYAAVVLVHGSDSVPRMTAFAELLAKRGMAVLTYDKRGVGASGGVYAGPEVGTNNISAENLNLLAKDASAAVNTLHKSIDSTPIGLLGFSQAGWIIPLAAIENSRVKFMVLFSGPTITTLEQLRFQFYTNGNADFWDTHTKADVRRHVENGPDRYLFESTDPKVALKALSIPGLWLFGEKDIQIPVKMDIGHLNALKAGGKPYDYCLFPTLGHNTAFSGDREPVDIAVQWIKRAVGKMETNRKK